MTALYAAKNLVVVSTNLNSGLIEALGSSCVPYVSAHKIHKINSHVLRIQVKEPGFYPRNPGPVTSFVILEKDLDDFAKCVRELSLGYEHSRGQPLHHEDPECPDYPRISLLLSFARPAGQTLSAAKQVSLLENLTWLNNVGNITLSGAASSNVKAILPGHAEVYIPPAGVAIDDDEEFMVKNSWYQNLRTQDGMDYAIIAKKMLQEAESAKAIGNWQLTDLKYLKAMTFLNDAFRVNTQILHTTAMDTIDTVLFHIQHGYVQLLIELQDWHRAIPICFDMLGELHERPWILKELVASGKEMRSLILRNLDKSSEEIARIVRNQEELERSYGPTDHNRVRICTRVDPRTGLELAYLMGCIPQE